MYFDPLQIEKAETRGHTGAGGGRGGQAETRVSRGAPGSPEDHRGWEGAGKAPAWSLRGSVALPTPGFRFWPPGLGEATSLLSRATSLWCLVTRPGRPAYGPAALGVGGRPSRAGTGHPAPGPLDSLLGGASPSGSQQLPPMPPFGGRRQRDGKVERAASARSPLGPQLLCVPVGLVLVTQPRRSRGPAGTRGSTPKGRQEEDRGLHGVVAPPPLAPPPSRGGLGGP